tara:strand:+ start:7132 stop:7428 length:297 start_codon:yes stop_codon:yes gene_type:complete
MNLFRLLPNFVNQKEETQGEKTISIMAYVVKRGKYNLKNPLIIVSFPGKEHCARKMTRVEGEVRRYLETILTKRKIKTNSIDTRNLPEDQRDLRGKKN